MPIPDYLTNNISRIEELTKKPQSLGKWNANYDNEAFDCFPIMIELRSRFPSKEIIRSDIVTLFSSGEKYLGFVAAMVWGFINASRPRIRGGDKTTTNLYRALSHPREKVEEAIRYAETCFEQNDYGSPFEKMSRGQCHNIPGIDYRYYTKIFFFIGQANPSIEKKPLIFDKWTSNAFFALLAQTSEEEVYKFFREVKDAKNKNNPGEVIVRTGKALVGAYLRFVELTNYWAARLGVSPDKLEEFIFGYDLRLSDKAINPRIELWDIVNAHRTLMEPVKAS